MADISPKNYSDKSAWHFSPEEENILAQKLENETQNYKKMKMLLLYDV